MRETWDENSRNNVFFKSPLITILKSTNVIRLSFGSHFYLNAPSSNIEIGERTASKRKISNATASMFTALKSIIGFIQKLRELIVWISNGEVEHVRLSSSSPHQLRASSVANESDSPVV